MKAHTALLLVFAWLVAPVTVMAQTRPVGAKPVVAIYEMDDVAHSGQAETFSRMIETSIAATSKFRIIERQNLDKLVSEQVRAKSNLVTTRTPGRVVGFEGADFLIYGSITSTSVSKKQDFGSTFGLHLMGGAQGTTCSNTIVTIGIDIKITDADSGEVRYVNHIDETGKSAAACGSDGQVDLSLLLRSAAEKIATGLVTTIYPIQVAAVQPDGVIVLNYGEGTLLPGAVMTVFTKGTPITDPASGEVIGNTEIKLGYIRVTDITGRVSRAVAISEFGAPPPVGAIARPISASEQNDLAHKRKH